MKNVIVLTGGGTMGHISPNIALMPYLTKEFDEIHYIGSYNGIEREKIESLIRTNPKLFYHKIKSTKLTRKSILKNISMPFILLKSIKTCKKLLKELNPKVVFSKGGYVSVPVVIASKKLNIPLVIHESDLSMGLANKIAAKRATTICTTFPETAKKYNGIFTGSPASDKLLSASPINAINKYSLNNDRKTITITGGSLGATSLNNAVLNILPRLVLKYNIVHLTGKGKRINFENPYYHQEEFSDNIGEIFKASDIIISRAGSNTIFELAMLTKPMLLIPLPLKSSRGDQIENANYFKSLGIANVLYEENFKQLYDAIETTIKDIPRLKHNLVKINFKNGTPLLLREIKKSNKKR